MTVFSFLLAHFKLSFYLIILMLCRMTLYILIIFYLILNPVDFDAEVFFFFFKSKEYLFCP